MTRPLSNLVRKTSLVHLTRALAGFILFFANSVDAADCNLEMGLLRAGNVCLVAKVFASPSAPGRAMAIVVHGDGGGFIEPAYMRRLERTAERIVKDRPGDGVVFVQRPGYRSELGRSRGQAKPEDDDYTAENVKIMADAVKELRRLWEPSHAVWVGHSGGAALGALLMGREPGIVQGAILSACPCGDIRQWRTHRNQSRGRSGAGTWPNSLSPVDHMGGLKPGIRVVLLTGDRDENTLARFNETWVEIAVSRGAHVTSVIMKNITHGQAADAAEVAAHASAVMEELK
jgi:hypothetical protein